MKNHNHHLQINLFSFVLPIALALPAFLIQDNVGLLGLLADLILSIVAVLYLFHKNKQAMWSYLFGLMVVIFFCVLGTYMNLYPGRSSWIQ
jgi:nicotinamide riboside transporter PnuC